MFPDFLPHDVHLLEHPDSIALAKSIKRIAIPTSLSNKAISTAYVTSSKGDTPLLLYTALIARCWNTVTYILCWLKNEKPGR